MTEAADPQLVSMGIRYKKKSGMLGIVVRNTFSDGVTYDICMSKQNPNSPYCLFSGDMRLIEDFVDYFSARDNIRNDGKYELKEDEELTYDEIVYRHER